MLGKIDKYACYVRMEGKNEQIIDRKQAVKQTKILLLQIGE